MSNGIDFVIGGKDQAKPAMTGVEKSLDRLQQKTDSIAKSTRNLTAITGALAAVYASVKAAVALLGGIDKINAAYDFQTKAVKNLTSALKARGQAGESAKMQAFAAELQKITGIGDEVTIGLMQQATAMGFATDKVDDATKAAIGLSDVTGKDLNQSLGDLKSALEGDFSAFEGLNPQIRFMRSNQEKLAAVMAMANQGIQSQSQNMNTVAGSGVRASGAFGDLLESIGALLAPVRVLINAGIQQLSESLISFLAPAVAYATEVLQNIGPIMDWVKEKIVAGVNLIIGAWTMFEVVLMNLSSVWELAVATAELYMVQIVESVMHAFTVEIPAYLTWFGENFVNLMRDAVMLAYTVVSNHVSKIIDTFRALWNFIASGGTSDVLGQLGEISGRSYLEGFQSSLTALPDIAGRQLTQREKDLADKIGAIGGRLGQEFSDKMKERMVGIGSTVTEEMKAANLDLKSRQQVITQGVQVTQGRLLTRGPGSSIPNKMDEIINLLKNPPKPKEKPKILVRLDDDQMNIWNKVEENTSNTVQMEAIV